MEKFIVIHRHKSGVTRRTLTLDEIKMLSLDAYALAVKSSKDGLEYCDGAWTVKAERQEAITKWEVA